MYYSIRRMITLALMFTLVVAIAMWALCVEAHGAEAYGKGLRPVTKKVYHVPKAKKKYKRQNAEIPKSYRSDEQEWAKGIRVKNQGNSGLCWAFSMTSAAEYSWAKESYEQTGAVAETSPGQLGYFYYNRVNDPLRNTAGDQNKVCEGDDWASNGGNQICGMQHLATYSGLSLEEKAPFANVNDHILDKKWDGTIPYDVTCAYDDYLTLQNSEFLPDCSDRDAVKSMVLEHGAVSIGLEFDTDRFMNLEEDGSEYEEGRSFFNYAYSDENDEDALDHALTIIGWDDNYPKENFTHGDTEIQRDESTPKANGAWVVQNSWGRDIHEGGIFYVSYESQDLAASDASAYDMQPADTYRYNFQYDGTADCGDASDDGNEEFFTDKGTAAANVFTNTAGNPISLSAVGYTAYNDGETPCTIDIYTDLRDPKDPTSGYHAGSTKAIITTAGVKTAVLSQTVPVDAGETYSVVFRFGTKTYFGVEKEREDFEVEVKPGQSFFKGAGSGTWEDMNDYDACFRIKGLANDLFGELPPNYRVDVSGSGKGGSVSWSGSSLPAEIVSGKTAMNQRYAAVGDRIRIHAAPAENYRLKSLACIGPDGKPIALKQADHSFVMPKGNVSVRAVFEALPKLKNPMVVKAYNKGFKARKLKKKAKKYRALVVTGAKGKVTYRVTYKNRKSRKALKFSPKTGKLQVKKGVKRGTYKITIKALAAGNNRYHVAAVTKTIKVKVK